MPSPEVKNKISLSELHEKSDELMLSFKSSDILIFRKNIGDLLGELESALEGHWTPSKIFMSKDEQVEWRGIHKKLIRLKSHIPDNLVKKYHKLLIILTLHSEFNKLPSDSLSITESSSNLQN